MGRLTQSGCSTQDPHIGVTATVYTHIRLRLQRQAIDLLGHALGNLAETPSGPEDGGEDADPSSCATPVH